MRVRMVVAISGGRGDNSPWPPIGGTLDVDDAEGADLCRARLAIPVPTDGTQTPEDGLEASTETRTDGRPIVNAPKEEWVAYAVSQGTDPAAAEAMTKADLLAQYGPRGESAAQ